MRAGIATRLRWQAGFSMVEMLIATLIMVGVVAAIFGTMSPATGAFSSQLEASDLQQRLRAAVDTLQKDLVMAGAGPYVGTPAGALFDYFAPVLPYRAGDVAAHPPGSFRPDVISVLSVRSTPAQTRVIRARGERGGRDLDVEVEPNCGADRRDRLCGFKEGMRVLIVAPDGNHDVVTITQVQDALMHLQHATMLSAGYDSSHVLISEVASNTYYLKPEAALNAYQLMHYDGDRTDLPVVDHVVALKFEYFGEPNPPQLLPDASLEEGSMGPWTTYGPKPPAAGVNNMSDVWGAGENCVFAIVEEQHTPRLSVLHGGSLDQIELTPAVLTDGPWCPDATSNNRYDADLLRIRRVRVTLRVHVAQAWLRGTAGVLFRHAGTARPSRYVPDQEIRFDVTPRNLNLRR